jgi:hypothetical protein
MKDEAKHASEALGRDKEKPGGKGDKVHHREFHAKEVKGGYTTRKETHHESGHVNNEEGVAASLDDLHDAMAEHMGPQENAAPAAEGADQGGGAAAPAAPAQAE